MERERKGKERKGKGRASGQEGRRREMIAGCFSAVGRVLEKRKICGVDKASSNESRTSSSIVVNETSFILQCLQLGSENQEDFSPHSVDSVFTPLPPQQAFPT